MRTIGFSSMAVGVLVALLASADQDVESPGEGLFLACWAAFPVLLATLICLGAASGRSTLPKAIAAGAFSFFTAGMSLLVFGLGYVSGPRNPDTAAHMAPFLWPPLILLLGALLSGIAFVLAWLRNRLGRRKGAA